MNANLRPRPLPEAIPHLRDRVSMFQRIPQPAAAHAVAWLSEFLGTTFFLFLALSGEQVAFSAVAGGAPAGLEYATQRLLYACLSNAFAFAVACWAFFRITSGLFNPAITFGMCLIGSLTWLRGCVIVVAQFLGAMTAAGIVDAVFPGRLVPNLTLGDGTTVARGFFIEAFLTGCFIFVVFMLAAEKHKGTFIAPIGLGLALFVVQLSGMLFTGCSLNPARAFSVAVATHHFPRCHWIYWLGPLMGSLAAVGLYRLAKMLEIETANALNAAAHQIANARDGVARPAGATEGHALGTVQEDDLKKGEGAGAGGQAAGEGPGARYLSGATAVNEQSASETDGVSEGRPQGPAKNWMGKRKVSSDV